MHLLPGNKINNEYKINYLAITSFQKTLNLLLKLLQTPISPAITTCQYAFSASHDISLIYRAENFMVLKMFCCFVL